MTDLFPFILSAAADGAQRPLRRQRSLESKSDPSSQGLRLRLNSSSNRRCGTRYAQTVLAFSDFDERAFAPRDRHREASIKLVLPPIPIRVHSLLRNKQRLRMAQATLSCCAIHLDSLTLFVQTVLDELLFISSATHHARRGV